MAPIRISDPDPIKYLLERRFPRYQTRLHPFVTSSGSSSDESFEKRQALEKAVEEYRRELEGKTAEDLAALFAAAQAKEAEAWRLKAEEEERAYFYNRPEAMADFGFWASAVFWRLEEGVALVFGRCPRKVTWEKLQRYLSNPFAKRYGDLRDLVARARLANMLTEPMPPGAFLAFAQRSGFPPPAELVAALAEKGVLIADWKTLHDATKVEAARLAAEVARLMEEVAQANLARAELEQQVQELTAKLSLWEFLPETPTYPRELDAALMAWRAITNLSEIPANPGEALERWLTSYQPPGRDKTLFSREARRRIARVCNWNKLGGRARAKEKVRRVKGK